MRRLARVILPLTFVSLILISLQSCARPPDAEADNVRTNADVRAVLEAQTAAWNRGDVEAFMEGYERSDDIRFISGDTLTRGWQTVTDRYKRNYDTREKMGTLAFSELDVKPISPFYAVVSGRFQLTRTGDTPRGRFTLLFRRTAEGWRIVHDHTSSASS